jgi:hypothetical protein
MACFMSAFLTSIAHSEKPWYETLSRKELLEELFKTIEGYPGYQCQMKLETFDGTYEFQSQILLFKQEIVL